MDDNVHPYERRLDAVSAETLNPMVQNLLGDASVTVTDWQYEALSGGFGGGTGPSLIYRFRGHTTTQQPWSLILKIILARNQESPSNLKYWKREYELYRSGWLETLPDGLSAPRCFSYADYPDEAVWIWMAEVIDYDIDPWAEKQYELIGRHLGQFNGAYLTGAAIPSAPWLGNDWLRKNAVQFEYERSSAVQAALVHPLMQEYFPSDALPQLLRLRDDVPLFLDVLAGLPQTFAHQDGMDRNLFICPNDVMAIDWALAGQAAIGTDAAACLLVNIFICDLDASQAEVMEPVLFRGYFQGLRDAGWEGPEHQARLGYTISTALKYLDLMSPLTYLTDEASHANIERIVGKPITYVLNQLAGIHRYAHKQADDARRLIRAVD